MKLSVVALLFVSLYSVVSAETKGFLFENGEYSYKIVLSSDDARTWYEAEEICREYEGGHLASIADEAENQYLNEKIQLISSSPRDPEVLWLGAKDEEHFGRAYQWADGNTFQYNAAFWAPSESQKENYNQYELCIALKSTGDLADWTEYDCYEPKGYICKIEGVPLRLVEPKRFGYEFDHGHFIYKYFFLQHEMLTWPEAEIYCRDAEGGHLASVQTLKENKYIEKKLRLLRYYFGFSKWWIGASDIYSEGTFNWTDGRPFTFQRWVQGEPSGKHRGKEEDCAVVTADPHWGRWKDEYCLHHLPFICKIRVCNQRADIAFAVDASTSVRGSGFKKSKDFIKFVLQRFKISQTGIHVGLIRFSSSANVVFNFEEHYTNNDINTAIDQMEHIRGGTRTDRALRLARNKLFLEKAEGGTSRPNIPKFLVVMTDGISKSPFITALEANALKKNGVHIIVVGVGRLLNRRELSDIASSPQDIITASSFKALKKIVVVTKEKVCGGL
ncbi:macrophage mannose receptor 1-like isoform X2 [Oculina patagonica]